MSDYRKLYRPSWAAYSALGLALVALAVSLFVVWVALSNAALLGTSARAPFEHCFFCQASPDSVTVAAQIGRLDLVSLALTVLGVILALAAIGGYLTVRHSAMRAAREETPTAVRGQLPELITADVLAQALQDHPQLLLSAVTQYERLTSGVSAEDADAIAQAFTEESSNGS